MVFRGCMNCTHEQLSLLFTYQKKKKKNTVPQEKKKRTRENKKGRKGHTKATMPLGSKQSIILYLTPPLSTNIYIRTFSCTSGPSFTNKQKT